MAKRTITYIDSVGKQWSNQAEEPFCSADEQFEMLMLDVVKKPLPEVLTIVGPGTCTDNLAVGMSIAARNPKDHSDVIALGIITCIYSKTGFDFDADRSLRLVPNGWEIILNKGE